MICKGVLFDLDGTLVHTKPTYRYMLIGRILNDLGFNSYTHRDIDRFWFETDRDRVIMECFDILDTSLFWRRYVQLEKPNFRRDYIQPYPDVKFIQELKEKGFKTGIITGAPKPIADLELELIGRKNFDKVVITREDFGIEPKPHPEGLEKCLKALKLEKNEALYVGNGHEDGLTANNANVPFVFLDRKEYKFNLDNLRILLTTPSLYGLRDFLDIE